MNFVEAVNLRALDSSDLITNLRILFFEYFTWNRTFKMSCPPRLIKNSNIILF